MTNILNKEFTFKELFRFTAKMAEGGQIDARADTNRELLAKLTKYKNNQKIVISKLDGTKDKESTVGELKRILSRRAFPDISSRIEKIKFQGTGETEIWGQTPVKKSKYDVGDKIYSWQNKDYAAEIVRKHFSPWTSPNEPHENDTWMYVVRLKDGQRSKWMGESSLFTTKQKEYKVGGKILAAQRMKDGGKLQVGDKVKDTKGRTGVITSLNPGIARVKYDDDKTGSRTFKPERELTKIS